jgi:hypothetical protein
LFDAQHYPSSTSIDNTPSTRCPYLLFGVKLGEKDTMCAHTNSNFIPTFLNRYHQVLLLKQKHTTTILMYIFEEREQRNYYSIYYYVCVHLKSSEREVHHEERVSNTCR